MDNEQKIVLIVDDSPTIRKQVMLILSKSGYEVREAGSKFGMMNNIEQYGKIVDLIIMDLTLKYEHGFDLITTLKESDNYNNIPIIVLTGHADTKNVLQAKELGVNGYLKKPIDEDLLIEKVGQILNKD